jgi:hypothetical protein
VIEEVAVDCDLLEREQFYIDSERPHFNIAPFASNPMLGRKQSAESIAKRVASRRANGKSMSGEQRKKISASLSGRKVGPPSDETKKKISASLMGHVVSRSTVEKILEKRAGYRHSEEVRKKIGEASVARQSHLNLNRKKETG